MIDPAILAAIRARLERSLALPAARYRPFIVAGIPLGLIDDARAERLARFGPGLFRIRHDDVALDDRLADDATRSAVLAEVAATLRSEGALPAWRNEPYAIAATFGEAPLFHLERGAARYFGLPTAAAHVNGFVREGNATTLWFARRSATKAVDPGMLDNLVGGGIAAGMSIEETVIKEAWEEAGIDEMLARSAHRVGGAFVRRPLFDGVQREWIFIHELELPAAFVPANQDGEAVEHRRVSLEDAARAIAYEDGPDQVTIDASIVVLDFLIRHGAIAQEARDFAALDALCRRDRDA